MSGEPPQSPWTINDGLLIPFVETIQESSNNTLSPSSQDETALLIGFNYSSKNNMLLIRNADFKLLNNVDPMLPDQNINYVLSFVEGSTTAGRKKIDLKEEAIPEESLPLKKKAKMKEVGSQRSCLKKANKKDINLDKDNVEHPVKCLYCQESGDSDDSYLSDDLDELKEIMICESMQQILDKMMERDVINREFRELIEKGLKEFNKDIFFEIKNGRKDHFSNELMAFALLLQFKRKPAFNFFKRTFHNNWPSYRQVKEWRSFLNSGPARIYKERRKISKSRGKNFI